MAKRAAEDELLRNVTKYARFHETVMSTSTDSDWTIDRSTCKMNLLWSSVPESDFFYSSPWRAKDKTMLHVDGIYCGTLMEPNIQNLMALAHPAPFGKGGETIVDPNVRMAYAIDANRIKMTYKHDYGTSDYDPLYRGYYREFKTWCGVNIGACKLYKMHIYPPGGHFDAHKDTPHGSRHIGSAIVQLPTAFTGGKLVVEHQGDRKEVTTGACFAAWYTDCKHWIEPVESGHRIVLQYDVILPDGTLTLPEEGEEVVKEEEKKNKEDKDSGQVEADEEEEEEEEEESSYDEEPTSLFPGYRHVHIRATDDTWTELATLIKARGSEKKNVALLLRHQYLNDEDGLSKETLKGTDKVAYQALASKGMEVYLAPLVIQTTDPPGDERGTLGVSSLLPLPNLYPTILYPGLDEPENALILIEKQEGADHTGNEAMEGHARYLSAALVIVPPPQEEGIVDKEGEPAAT